MVYGITNCTARRTQHAVELDVAKAKVKLPLCTPFTQMWEMVVRLHLFLTSELDKVVHQPHSPAALEAPEFL